MFSLRSLSKVIPILFCAVAGATPGSLQSHTSTSSLRGSPSTAQQDNLSQTSTLTQSFLYQSPEMKGGWTFQVGNTISQTPDMQMSVRDSKGNEIILGNENKWTQDLKLNLAVHQKTTSYRINLNKSVDNTVFASRGGSLEVSSQIPDRLAELGFSISASERHHPQTYYFDNFFPESSLKWRERPSQLSQQKLNSFFEQIWSDTYKTRAEISFGLRNEERPSQLSAELRNYLVLDLRNSLRVDVGMSGENRSEDLQNEHGYYNMSWIEAQVQHLITYNLLLGGSYGYLVEREDEVRTGKVTQVGSDLVGLNALYSGRGWQATLKWEATQSNTGFGSEQVQGILSWEI